MYGSLQRRKENKKKVNEQFGRKMNEDVNGNRKSFWKDASNVKGGKVENCSRIKDGNGRLAQENNEVTREVIKGGGDRVLGWIWRLCNIAFEWYCA